MVNGCFLIYHYDIMITIRIQLCLYWAGSCKKHDGLKQGGRDPQLLVDWGTRSFLLHPPLNTGHRAGHSWRYYNLVPKLRSPARQDTTVYKCTSNPRYVAPPIQCAPNSNHTPTTNPQRYLVPVPPSPPSAPKPQPQIVRMPNVTTATKSTRDFLFELVTNLFFDTEVCSVISICHTRPG